MTPAAQQHGLAARILKYIQQRRDEKLDKEKNADTRLEIRAKYEPETWLSNAVQRAEKLSFVTHAAKYILSGNGNLRVLETADLACSNTVKPMHVWRQIAGGFLVQDFDQPSPDRASTRMKIVTKREPTARERDDMTFGWRVVKHVMSNAIVYCKRRATVGFGTGQTSRVDSARIAAWKARQLACAENSGVPFEGLVAASDAFLPFPDAIQAMAEAGVSALVQPGGSIRDKEVIRAADRAGIAMGFTGMRQFRH